MSLPQFVPQNLSTQNSDNKQIVRAINYIQSQLVNILNFFTKSVQFDNILLQNIALKSGLNQIPHTLGRNLTGWTLVGQSAAASLYDEQASNPSQQIYLYLVASAPCTVSLLVF